MTYCFSNRCGGPVFERNYPMGQAPRSIEVAGVTLYRDYQAEQGCYGKRHEVNPWENHYSLSMGATTDAHAAEIAAKCKAAKVSCEFDSSLRIKVNDANHQIRIADAIFGKGKVRNLDGVRG